MIMIIKTNNNNNNKQTKEDLEMIIIYKEAMYVDVARITSPIQHFIHI